ncbi:hypothetical protein IRJ41_013072 [Triplophysa rosa]|uniref:Uncharacterized protein n=1 Tax=Triplophysa rosa TaxID=992332 RepID=A0A9W7T754_TRIRA|nr:hypothetical protein IRJ41_013072 [Triplophysa rosa]
MAALCLVMRPNRHQVPVAKHCQLCFITEVCLQVMRFFSIWQQLQGVFSKPSPSLDPPCRHAARLHDNTSGQLREVGGTSLHTCAVDVWLEREDPLSDTVRAVSLASVDAAVCLNDHTERGSQGPVALTWRGRIFM